MLDYIFAFTRSIQASSNQRLESLMRRQEQSDQFEASIGHTKCPIANSIAQRTKQ